jgi:hypothetical protein
MILHVCVASPTANRGRANPDTQRCVRHAEVEREIIRLRAPGWARHRHRGESREAGRGDGGTKIVGVQLSKPCAIGDEPVGHWQAPSHPVTAYNEVVRGFTAPPRVPTHAAIIDRPRY